MEPALLRLAEVDGGVLGYGSLRRLVRIWGVGDGFDGVFSGWMLKVRHLVPLAPNRRAVGPPGVATCLCRMLRNRAGNWERIVSRWRLTDLC